MGFDNVNNKDKIKIFSVEKMNEESDLSEQKDNDKIFLYENSNHIRFIFKKIIKNFNYEFNLKSYADKERLFFEFKTEFDYAKTQLNRSQLDDLFLTTRDFFESIYEYNKKIKEIEVIPSSASYLASDVNDCIDQILSIDKETTKEKILKDSNYNMYKIFNLYEKKFGKKYEYKNNNKDIINAKEKRQRLFVTYFEKYLKNWNITEKFTFDGNEVDEIVLTRKEK